MYEFGIVDIFPYLFMVSLLHCFMMMEGDAIKKASLCLWSMFLFSAIRYGIGYDYYSYMQACLHELDAQELERFEPLSRVLIEIGYYTHYQFFFAISSFLILYPVYKACVSLSVFPAFALFIYFLFPKYYLESFSIVRNCIAYSMVFYAYYQLHKDNRIASVFFLLIAFLFHKSALIGILIYPIYYIHQSFKLHLIGYIVSFFISVVVMTLIGQYASAIPILANIEHYASTGRSEGGSMTFIINFITIVNFVLWHRLENVDSVNSKYLAYFNLGTIMWNVFIGVDSTIALRLSSFFQIFIILLVPQYCYAVNERYSMWVNRGAYSFFLLLFASYFYINISSYLSNPERMSNLPYQTIFWHKDYNNYQY